VTTELTNNIQIIEQDGKPAFAVIPWDEFQALLEGVEPNESEVWFPNEVVKANVRGDSLVKAWREYKGLTQAELAAKAGIKQPALTRMEKPDANPRKSSLTKLADAMDITVEQLLE
jgi:DNA-binding XRE family transcriptional regulator